MTMHEPVDQSTVDQSTLDQGALDQTPVVSAEPESPVGRRIPLRSLMTLCFSACALAFLGWAIVTHPGHQSLFGPAPSAQAIAASQAPAVHPVGS